ARMSATDMSPPGCPCRASNTIFNASLRIALARARIPATSSCRVGACLDSDCRAMASPAKNGRTERVSGWLGFVAVDRPVQVVGDRLVNGAGMMAAHHRDMVLETVARDEAEQRPEPRHFRHRDAAVHTERICGELAFADIGLDRPESVIGRGAEERHRSRLDLALDGPEAVFL